MAKRSSQTELIKALSDFIAYHKGLPVFVGVGLVFVSLILSCFPALANDVGFLGWLVRSRLLLHLGVIIGFVGLLVGDAL